MNGKKALITGITGFVGSHLAEFLLNKNYEVWGIMRRRSRTENIESILEKIKILEADITDAHATYTVIEKAQPDYIFHLAGQTFVPTSFQAPQETIMTNVIGTLNILEAVRKSKIDPIIQIAGSSEEYGMVYPEEIPIKETNPLRPQSPYGVSKVAEDLLGMQYNKSYGIKIIVTRAFNHTGPRRGESFVTSNFAKQVALIEKGKQEPIIFHGNLEARRDFSDVRDIVRAYELAVLKCPPGEHYNICSEKPRKIQEVLNLIISLAKVKITTKLNSNRLRPSDVPYLIGDCTKFKKITGWEPQIPFEKTIEDLLNYWRERV